MKAVPRVGFGYDIHRLSTGRPLTLGATRIESERGLLGHSDGDVVLHALSDAVFGALASGDIGEHFPDTCAENEGMDSREILRTALDEAAAAGYQLRSADITILAEYPKLGPVKEEIRQNIADLVNLPPEAVGLKARTNEGLGAVGRQQAIACYAVAVLA